MKNEELKIKNGLLSAESSLEFAIGNDQ